MRLFKYILLASLSLAGCSQADDAMGPAKDEADDGEIILDCTGTNTTEASDWRTPPQKESAPTEQRYRIRIGQDSPIDLQNPMNAEWIPMCERDCQLVGSEKKFNVRIGFSNQPNMVVGSKIQQLVLSYDKPTIDVRSLNQILESMGVSEQKTHFSGTCQSR